MNPAPNPDYSNVGLGATGTVQVNHDASQHVTSHQVTTSTDNSQTRNEHHDHSDRRVDQSTTHVHSGLSGRVALALAGVIVLGFALLALLLRQPATAPVVVLPATPVLQAPITAPPSRHLPQDEPAAARPPLPQASAAEKTMPPVVEPAALEVSLNRAIYRVGDLMDITVTTRQAGHLQVLAVWADGRVDCLFPNSLRRDGRMAAGTTLRLPHDLPPAPDGQVLRYPMAMPELPGSPASAMESIIAVLSPAPLALPSATGLAASTGFSPVGVMADADFRTRGPRPQFIRLQQAATLDFGGLPQAAVHYQIHR